MVFATTAEEHYKKIEYKIKGIPHTPFKYPTLSQNLQSFDTTENQPKCKQTQVLNRSLYFFHLHKDVTFYYC